MQLACNCSSNLHVLILHHIASHLRWATNLHTTCLATCICLCHTLQCTATHCNCCIQLVLQLAYAYATRCNALQHTATVAYSLSCNLHMLMPHAAMHCNTLQLLHTSCLATCICLCLGICHAYRHTHTHLVHTSIRPTSHMRARGTRHSVTSAPTHDSHNQDPIPIPCH